jgi:polysaccharide pyruvyl transferase WcaK-like protein
MKNKYFITGLCMQGNKGGPAIALSLTSAIRKHIPDAEFVFSVPSAEISFEKQWAEKYGFEVVENIDLRHLLPPYSFPSERRARFRIWRKALRSSKAMIQMSAISYVGPPSATPNLRTLLSGRFMDFCLSKLLNRSMFAWTQSYGPLSTPIIRFLATIDLKAQPVIFCRGQDCLEEVKGLLPRKYIYSYPDIAITLDYDALWAKGYMKKKHLPGSGFVSLSPSAVIYSKSHTLEAKNLHIQTLKKICTDLIAKGLEIVIVPHTFRPGKHHPNVCDYATSRVLLESLEKQEGIFLVDEDLSASELKSIISLAQCHIGGRYHSVVAALSSGVPTLSLSWHPKYRDVMREYGVEDFVLDDYNDSSKSLLDDLIKNREEIASKISSAHERVLRQSDENVLRFIELIR